MAARDLPPIQTESIAPPPERKARPGVPTWRNATFTLWEVREDVLERVTDLGQEDRDRLEVTAQSALAACEQLLQRLEGSN